MFLLLLLFFVALGKPAHFSNQRKTPCTLYDGNDVQRNHKVLIFIDENYMDMLHNWYAHYSSICGGMDSALEIVCMDSQSDALVRSFSNSTLHCSPHSFDLKYDHNKTIFNSKLGEIWIKRMSTIDIFLRQGVDLVLSDTDALWMRDPFQDLNTFNVQSDVVASRGWFPWHLYDRWGSCLCMGFVYLKSTSFTVDLIQAVSKQMKRHQEIFLKDIRSKLKPDDQYSINQILADWNISWDGMQGGRRLPIQPPPIEPHNKSAAGKKKKYVSPFDTHFALERNNVPHTGTVLRQGNRSSGQVVLLPHVKYVRSCHNQSLPWIYKGRKIKRQIKKRTSKASIVHCRVTTGRINPKKEYLISFGFWKVPVLQAYRNTMARQDVMRAKERMKAVENFRRAKERKRLKEERRRKEKEGREEKEEEE